MKTLLRVQTSLFGAGGQSSQLIDRFVQNWLEQNPQGRVITRDLAAHPVPHLTAEVFQAFSAKPENRTPEQQTAVEFSDSLIEELRSADVIVFGVPMYNFSVPSTLRAYFDYIARAGLTFRYTSEGAEGLIKGKKAYVFTTRGGVYAENQESQTFYLRQFLGFIGITDVQFIHAEGLGMGESAREKALSATRQIIAGLFTNAAVA